MILVDALSGEARAYNVSAIYAVYGVLDLGALDRALGHVCARHDIFRMRASGRADDASLTIHDAAPRPLVRDLTDLDRPLDRAIEISRRLALDPFDLAATGTLRTWVLRVAPDMTVLGLAAHHLALDRRSLVIWATELRRFYSAEVAGTHPSDRERPPQFHEAPEPEQTRADLDFWVDELSGVSHNLPLPFDRRRRATPSHAARQVCFALSEQMSEAVRALALACSTTPFTFLLGAFAAVLSRYAMESAVVVGCPFDARPPGYGDCIGFFANSMPVVVRTPPATTGRDLVVRTRNTMAEAQDRQTVAFDEIVRAISPPRIAGVNPLFQVWFDLADARGAVAAETLSLPGTTVEYLTVDQVRTRLDLEMHLVSERKGTFTGRLIFATELFDSDTAELLCLHFQNFVEQAAAAPDRDIDDFELEP